MEGGRTVFVASSTPAEPPSTTCGYIGGSGTESFGGIASRRCRNAYVTGGTKSTEATFSGRRRSGPQLHAPVAAGISFVAKVNAPGSALDYCGYIGGDGTDVRQRRCDRTEPATPTSRAKLTPRRAPSL